MAGSDMGPALREMGRIFNGGAASGRGDAELLGVFASEGDERAFEVLVSRHGPLVLATCRATLRDPNDAEDAFQATFLVLARKARSLRIRSDLAGWLHRVAVRVARQHRIAEDRRRRREGRAGGRPDGIAPDRPASDAERDELALFVHREVDRLPDRLRLPVIRCHLEGRSYAEAASSLGIPEPTLRGRLSRARALLRDRLARRGFSGALPIALDLPRVPPAVPIGSVRSAARAASWLSAGRMVGTGPLPTAYSLMEDALMAMTMTRVKVSASVLSMAMLSGLATAGVWATAVGSSPTSRPSAVSNPSAPPPPTVQDEKGDEPGPDERSPLRYAGVVLGPEGAPIEDAALVFTFHTGRGDEFRQFAEERARTDADGRFEFEVDPFRLVPGLDENPLDRAFLIAVADGYGPVSMAAADPQMKRRNTFQQPIDAIEFRLPKDDVPIVGWLVDGDGRPVVGATIRPTHYNGNQGPSGTPLPLFEPDLDLEGRFPYQVGNASIDEIVPEVTSDKQGTFRIEGVGRERTITLSLSGPGLKAEIIRVMTRPGQGTRVPSGSPFKLDRPIDLPATLYDAASFVHIVQRLPQAEEEPALPAPRLRIETVYLAVPDSSSIQALAARISGNEAEANRLPRYGDEYAKLKARLAEELAKEVERMTPWRVVATPEEADLILQATPTPRAFEPD